jgi:hypothetical protein
MTAEIEFEYSSSGICSICAGPLPADGLVSCPRCKARYHADCWEYNRSRCAVYGCEPRGEPQRQAHVAGGTLPYCAFHPGNERILDCRGCGRSICTLCDIVIRGRHYCPVCYEFFLPASERGPARTNLPPRPDPEDRTLCAFHQRNLRTRALRLPGRPRARLSHVLRDRPDEPRALGALTDFCGQSPAGKVG